MGVWGRFDMPIIGHVGIDGSGKSYGMAQDCARISRRENRRKNGKEVWSLRPMEGARTLKHPHQMIYLENAIVFLDELQRLYPADNRPIDEITHHIISTHRHSKLAIHWASQDWEYVHKFWRLETGFCWRYEALWRDPESGESRIKRHKRTLVKGTHMELHRRKPDILKKEKFWITKKGIALFNSYEKIEVAMRKVTPEYIASIEDPRSDWRLPAPSKETVHHEGHTNEEKDTLDPQINAEEYENEIDREDEPDELYRSLNDSDPA